MKKLLGFTLALALCAGLAGCAGGGSSSSAAPAPSGTSSAAPVQSGSGSSSQAGPAAVELVRAMMALDYSGMSVGQFNTEIQRICTDAGSNIFAVIADVTPEEERSERGLYNFMRTTLDYSSAQIFGEPGYIGSASYITAPGLNATQYRDKLAAMEPAERDAYVDSIIADMDIVGSVYYVLWFDIADDTTLLVADRDSRMNALRSDIEEWLLAKTPEEIEAEGFEEEVKQEFARLDAAHSDAAITFRCELQMVERMSDYA